MLGLLPSYTRYTPAFFPKLESLFCALFGILHKLPDNVHFSLKIFAYVQFLLYLCSGFKDYLFGFCPKTTNYLFGFCPKNGANTFDKLSDNAVRHVDIIPLYAIAQMPMMQR